MRRYYILMNNSFRVMNTDEYVKEWAVKHTPLIEIVVYIEDVEDLGNSVSVSEEDMGNCVTGADLCNNVSISEKDMGNIKKGNGKGKFVVDSSRAKGQRARVNLSKGSGQMARVSATLLMRNTASGIDHCPISQHYQWWLRAKLGKKHKCWEMSKLGPPHSCFMDTNSRSHKNLYKNLLANDIESLVQVNPAYDVKYITEHATSKYDYNVLYQKSWQALKRARENVFRVWESSDQYLPNYMEVLQRYNHGTIVEWRHKDTINGVCTLGYVFWAFRPCIEVFKHYRKILTIDGTHMYTNYKHILMIVNTLDANQKFISLDNVIVDEENFRS
ncbi:hypothetical protein ACS0TY_017230 [Phlomoides rotata]